MACILLLIGSELLLPQTAPPHGFEFVPVGAGAGSGDSQFSGSETPGAGAGVGVGMDGGVGAVHPLRVEEEQVLGNPLHLL